MPRPPSSDPWTGFSLVASGALAFNTFFIYLPNHLIATTDSEPGGVLLVSVLALLGTAAAAVGLGRMSEHGESLGMLIATDLLAGAAVGGILSVSMLAEMFPTRMRATGVALTAGLASAVVGGTAPFVNQVLFQTTGRTWAPMLYVSGVAALAFLAVRAWPETAFDDLRGPVHGSATGGSGDRASS